MESGSLQHQEANNLTISAFMVLVSTGNFANLSSQCFSTGPLHLQLSSYRFTHVFILLSQNHPYCFLLYSKFFYFLKQNILTISLLPCSLRNCALWALDFTVKNNYQAIFKNQMPWILKINYNTLLRQMWLHSNKLFSNPHISIFL